MDETTIDRRVSRRTALAGLGAGGVGLAMTAAYQRSAAQDATPDMASHPMVGTWLTGRSAADIDVTYWAPDGTMIVSGNLVSVGQNGALGFSNIPMGVWEPVSESGIHFTFTAANFDAAGNYTGNATVDGYPVASDDGSTFWDDGSQVRVTIRDATGAVVQVIGEDGSVPGIGGVRMVPGNAGYDELLSFLASKQSGTPTT